jgi:hypothetical protein
MLLGDDLYESLVVGVRSGRHELLVLRQYQRRLLGLRAVHVQRRLAVWAGAEVLGRLHLRLDLLSDGVLFRLGVRDALADSVRRGRRCVHGVRHDYGRHVLGIGVVSVRQWAAVRRLQRGRMSVETPGQTEAERRDEGSHQTDARLHRERVPPPIDPGAEISDIFDARDGLTSADRRCQRAFGRGRAGDEDARAPPDLSPAAAVASRGGFVDGLLRSATDSGGVSDPECFSKAPGGRWRLYSRQQLGQRHSTSRVPSAVLARVSLQPNCALMSV